MSHLPRRRTLVAATPLLIVPLLAGCSVVTTIAGPNRLVPFAKPVEADGSSLTLRWTGSSCSELRRALVDETPTEVRIELMVRETSDDCDDAAVDHESTVRLEAPLGDRTVVDATCLLPEFTEHPRCEDPEG